MARYALLPTPGDPAVVTFWKLFYDRVWGHLFDGLLVCHNPTPEVVGHADYIRALFSGPEVTLLETGGVVGHGEALRRLVCHRDTWGNDLLAFFEDDAITFKAAQLAEALALVEARAADVVGSPRGSASPNLVKAEDTRFGGPFQAGEDTGPNFWPNLFITHKATLYQTDMDFNAHGWEAGERIEELGWTPSTQLAGDTMVWLSIQLRHLLPGDRIRLVPQWHSSPYDLDNAARGRHIWSDACQWFHIGSLSSLPLGCDLSGMRQHVQSEAERLEWERRLMYVWLCAEVSARLAPGFGLAGEYESWVLESAGVLGLNVERMKLWKYAYRRRLGLNDGPS